MSDVGDADVKPVRDSFKAWRLEEWVSTFLHKSVILEIKMAWYGKPRVTLNSVLKILFWEFCAKLQNGVDTLKYRQQKRVWNPRGSKSLRLVVVGLLQKSDRPHRQDSMETFLHGESDAGASCSNVIGYLGDLGGIMF